MKDGDISNQSATFVIMIDGCGFVYQLVQSWWLRFLRRVAWSMKSKSLMLHTIRLDRVALSIVLNLIDNGKVHLKVLAFTPQEFFILTRIIFDTYGISHIVTEVASEAEFKDYTMYADFMLSNHYTKVNGSARKVLFNNTSEVRSVISQEVGYSGGRP